MTLQILARLDYRERARGVDAQRLKHLGSEDFAYRALERQPTVTRATPWRLAGTLGAKVHKPPGSIAELSE